jgi:secreted PhoX family phosphatase
MALALSGALSAPASAQTDTTAGSAPSGGDGPYGPLAAEPDANGLLLPAGFTSRIIGTTGEPVEGTDHPWHGFPDGGACFPADDGGWVYVSNSEAANNTGGVGAVRFDADGQIVDAYRILDGTNINCAGGPTPWGTWLSCEEFDWHGLDPALAEATGTVAGQVWECNPMEAGEGTPLPALGLFQHEAVAVDPVNEKLYLTEDKPDGRLYRFTPEAYPDLTAGTLEAASVDGDRVTWVAVPDPSAADQRTAEQVADTTTVFAGGEGIWWHGGIVYFTNKGDNRVHAIDTTDDSYEVLYDAAELGEDAPLTGVDNITVEEGSGDLVVAEDGGNMELVLVTADREVAPLVRAVGHEASEMTGPAFSPDGTRLYFSSQRGAGTSGIGITWEVTGPFRGVELRETVDTTSPASAPTTLREVAQGGDSGTDDGGDDGVSPAVIGGGAVVVVGAVAAGIVALRKRGDAAGSHEPSR